MKNCFIISPIGEIGSEIRKRSDEILIHIIRPILQEFDYKAIRADEISEFGLITNQVIEHIVYDDLVICDLTYKNPNVYYELAIRHIVQKPIIQLIDEKEKLPFDVINTRTIKINHRNLTGADNAKIKIKEYLKRIESGVNKIETPTSSVIDIDITLFDKSPISNINITYSKIFELLKKAEKDINNPMNIMSQEYINRMKEVDSLKSAFLANISHEIRTPINAIIGFTNLITDENINLDERKQFGEVITLNANHLLEMMNSMVDLSFIESNQIKIEVSKGVINTLMEEVYIIFKEVLEKKNSNIDIHLVNPTQSNLNFVTDFNRLRQVLSILLDNAIKFTEKGEIDIYYEIKDRELYCYVKDTGRGIQSKDYSVIFEKFRQVEYKNQRMYSGNGIGLTIAKGLVEKLGGRIWVESQLNIGSTFFFSIPELSL